MQLLNVTYNTHLKARLIDFEELQDSEKYYLQVGDVLDVNAYLEEGDYYKIFLRNPISGLETWFICKEHVEITEFQPNDPFAIMQRGRVVNRATDDTYLRNDESQERPRTKRGGSALEGEALRALQYEAVDDWSGETYYGASDIGDNVLGTYEQPVPSCAPVTQSSPVRHAPLESTNSTEAELRKFTLGKVLFHSPNQMKVGVPAIVRVRISENLTQDFFKGLTHTQKIEVENIRISRFMTVILTGDDFKIKPFQKDDEQIIEEEDFTQWKWEVTPLKGGKRQLFVNVTIRVKVDNQHGSKNLEALNKEIDIIINPVYSVQNFASQHWEWILGSAFIPIALQILSKK